ncbi:hypothetical protein HYPSUDRAFT_599819 [Hypholoma sublateritium FD-334 SS-4]|uniref:Uncharacterized protein n=1 Tax=Hypholoma sublateritium (strain FD-334 SS-4) TaxID=945553 RepID=A0A0D2MHC4_HYPSF|nr:hypothetical protein HYPSUDRAFT_599819 [Hypholoma sublateritium FD-334 SS-4]
MARKDPEGIRRVYGFLMNYRSIESARILQSTDGNFWMKEYFKREEAAFYGTSSTEGVEGVSGWRGFLKFAELKGCQQDIYQLFHESLCGYLTFSIKNRVAVEYPWYERETRSPQGRIFGLFPMLRSCSPILSENVEFLQSYACSR